MILQHPNSESYIYSIPKYTLQVLTVDDDDIVFQGLVPGNLTTSGSWVQPGEMLGIELAAGQEGRWAILMMMMMEEEGRTIILIVMNMVVIDTMVVESAVKRRKRVYVCL